MALCWNLPAKNAVQLYKMGFTQVLQYDRRPSLNRIVWQLGQAKLPFDKSKMSLLVTRNTCRQLASPN